MRIPDTRVLTTLNKHNHDLKLLSITHEAVRLKEGFLQGALPLSSLTEQKEKRMACSTLLGSTVQSLRNLCCRITSKGVDDCAADLTQEYVLNLMREATKIHRTLLIEPELTTQALSLKWDLVLLKQEIEELLARYIHEKDEGGVTLREETLGACNRFLTQSGALRSHFGVTNPQNETVYHLKQYAQEIGDRIRYIQRLIKGNAPVHLLALAMLYGLGEGGIFGKLEKHEETALYLGKLSEAICRALEPLQRKQTVTVETHFKATGLFRDVEKQYNAMQEELPALGLSRSGLIQAFILLRDAYWEIKSYQEAGTSPL